MNMLLANFVLSCIIAFSLFAFIVLINICGQLVNTETISLQALHFIKYLGISAMVGLSFFFSGIVVFFLG